MDKMERGTRNLEKLRKIAHPKVGRGSVTFWNPTQAQKTTATVHSNDASLVAQLHDIISPEQQGNLLLNIATLSGFYKILNLAWSAATLKTTARYIYDAHGLRKVAV